MVKRKFTMETYELAKEEFLSVGKTNLTNIAKKYSICLETFRKLLKEDGIDKVNRSSNVSIEQIMKIKELRLQGWGYNRIAKEVGCDPKTVGRHVKNMGIEVEVIKQTNREKNGKYTLDYYYFSKIETEEQAYWLGFIFADGSLSKNRLTIRLKKEDKNHLESFAKAIKFDGLIADKTEDTNFKSKSEASSVEINSTDMIRTLNQYVPIGKKSDKIRMPKLRPELYRHFIRGYFDGDGYVISTRQQIGFCSNLAFLEDLKKIFIKNGLAKKEDGNLRKNTSPYYGEYVYGKIVSKKIMDWIQKDAKVRLERKYNDFYSPGGFKTS